MYLYDFPNADFFNFLIVKVISLFFPDSVVVMNVFFLLTFPLTAMTSLFTFKYFKIPHLIAVALSLLYAFAPYHFYRGMGHLFLSAYYIIPLVTLVMLSLWSLDIPFFCQPEYGKDSYRFDGLSKRSFFYFIICAIAGSAGIYYSFFSCFFIFIAGLASFLTKPRKYKIILVSSLLLISIILFSSFLNLLPSVIYNRTHTPNPEVAKRVANETEIYGLKMVDLLLPTSGLNRIYVLQRLGQRYKNRGLLAIQNENISAYLGVVGGLGFLYLLSIRVFIFRFRANLLIERLSILNIAAFLFATTGGGAVLFALLVTPQLRGVNRISIFIHFFALLTVGLVIDRL
jgi:phosphoglycerol transferase